MRPPTDTVTWEDVLSDLEAQIALSERLLHQGDGGDAAAAIEQIGHSWQPPTGLGPLPVELRPRARHLVDRQGALIASLQAATAGQRKQAKLVDTMKFEGAPTPIYLDQNG